MRTSQRWLAMLAIACVACTRAPDPAPSPDERRAIADTLVQLVKSAYDLSKPDPAKGMLSLYPDSGRVVSASGGRVVMTRDSLAAGIHYFWKYIGSNMKNASWNWQDFHIDVLSRTAAVMTATYRIPHLTPRGLPHELGGAWTAVWVKRDGRWMVIQEHLSDLPPAPADSMAAMDMARGH